MVVSNPSARADALPRLRRATAAGLAVAALALGSCSAQEPEAAAECAVSAKLVPACGVLLGVTPEDQSASTLAAADGAAARPYDFVYRFHDVDDVVPDAVERNVVAAGRMLHLSLDVRSHQAGGRTYTWREVADGVIDTELTAQAKGIAGLKVPVWVTFDHEPDNAPKKSRGTGAEFVDAWQHVHELFTASGATNAVWVWVVTGAPESLDRVEQFWPGNDVVDWVSWESYNPSGCRMGRLDPAKWQSFEESLLVFHRWLAEHAARVGIDPAKPQMISESGSVADPSNPERRSAWYRDIAGTLARYPLVKAVGLWDHTGNNKCDYRYSGDPKVQAAVNTLLTSQALSQTSQR